MSGISSHTLRMWERRYGFPEPQRTPGGARRYSEHDVATLKLIARALETGYRAGDVVGQAPDALRSMIAEQMPSPAPLGAAPEIDQVLGAILSDDAAGARRKLREAVAALGPKRFLTDYAHPLVLEVGERWAKGELAVRHEHLASDLLTTQIKTLLATFEGSGGRPRVLLTTLPGEQHGLPLDLVSLYLAVNRATPLSLGVSTPVKEIAEAATALSADVVGLSISAAADLATASAHVDELLGELPRRITLWLGGTGADALPDASGAIKVTSWDDIDRELVRRRDLS